MDIITLRFSDNNCTVQPLYSALVARNAANFAVSLMRMSRFGLRLEVDLSRLRHMDGAGMGALVTCSHAMQRGGCQMVLTHVAQHLKDELRACGLNKLLGRSTAQGV
jgi:anti-anti-sigma factor